MAKLLLSSYSNCQAIGSKRLIYFWKECQPHIWDVMSLLEGSEGHIWFCFSFPFRLADVFLFLWTYSTVNTFYFSSLSSLCTEILLQNYSKPWSNAFSSVFVLSGSSLPLLVQCWKFFYKTDFFFFPITLRRMWTCTHTLTHSVFYCLLYLIINMALWMLLIHAAVDWK